METVSCFYCGEQIPATIRNCAACGRYVGSLNEASACVSVGAVYRHFKGTQYRVTALARASDSLRPQVVYADMNGKTWTRDLLDFIQKVPAPGSQALVPRFMLVPPSRLHEGWARAR